MNINLLRKTFYNEFGFFDATPGMALKCHLSDSTIRRYIKKGWLEDRGMLVVTKKGIKEA